MKSFAYLGLALCPAILIGCSGPTKKDESRKSLSYTYRTFRVESKVGCTSDTVQCASYEVEYPEFSSVSDAVIDSLQNVIDEIACLKDIERDSNSFQTAGQQFVDQFDQFKAEFPESGQGWYFRASVSVSYQSDTLLSLRSDQEFYTGGAHGGYSTYFATVDPRSGKRVTLDQLLIENYQAELHALGEKSFRSLQGIEESVTLADAGFSFPDDTFSLNDNYGFTEEGLLFVFNPYEVAPYVLGSQSVIIPYDLLDTLLKR